MHYFAWLQMSSCLSSDLKLVFIIFFHFFIFHQLIALQKTMKNVFISSEKLFLFTRYSNFCISVFPSFFLSATAFQVDPRKILKVYDVINCLNKKLITHSVWYLEKKIRSDIETLFIDKDINKEHFYGKIMQNMCTKI